MWQSCAGEMTKEAKDDIIRFLEWVEMHCDLDAWYHFEWNAGWIMAGPRDGGHDINKPKHFMCAGCRERLEEKNGR